MAQSQRSYRTRAVVLRRRDYGDADRILTLYTPDAGKQQFIAKGIRKTTSRKAGHLELFTHSALLVAKARTWPIITEASTVESFARLRQDLLRIGYAGYVAELVDSFTETDDENLLLWDLLLVALRYLDTGADEERLRIFVRWFELHFLSLTGFQPQLFHCIGCGEPLTPVTNYLSILDGGVLCPTCGRNHGGQVEEVEPDVLKVLRFFQSRPWETVEPVAIRHPILLRVENILYRYLLAMLERQLKSTDFVRRLQHLHQMEAQQRPAPPQDRDVG